jgi:hypothetical protein
MRPQHWLYTIPLQLRSLFRWAQADQELDDANNQSPSVPVFTTLGLGMKSAAATALLVSSSFTSAK